MTWNAEANPVSYRECPCQGTGYITRLRFHRLPGKDRVGVVNTGRQCRNPECLALGLSRKYIESFAASIEISRWN